MLTHITCECGNEVKVADGDAEVRCARCGRRVSIDDANFDHLLDEDHLQPIPVGSGSRPASRAPSAAQGQMAAGSQVNDDPEATIAQTVVPSEETLVVLPKSNSKTSEAHTLPADDFEINHFPHTDSSIIQNISNSEGSSHGAKYDLSQRVMRPITKSVAQIIPYSGMGDYGIHRVLRQLQNGGMGRILVAYDQYLKREVALKELHSDVAGDESIVRRFIGEAEITAQLEHPGVVPIHQIGQGRDELPYYTMKMVKGETLQEAIKAYHQKPSKAKLYGLVRRLVSVSKTIAFAHSKGVIHRDLKPANVMLGEHGETLVMDWGLAKPYNQEVDESYASVIHRTRQPRPELTMVGAIVGTPAFMSPEQALAEENMVGPLSDVFSLGTVLYYLLAGQTAFSGRSTQEVLNKVRACKPTPPSHVKANVPHGLEAICLKAMAKLPEDRYQGASEFADDLCRWLDDEPIVAENPSVWTKIRWWVLRHRTLMIAVPCVLILSIMLACIGAWLLLREYPSVQVPGSEHASVFKGQIQIMKEPEDNVWMTTRPTGELLITCQVHSVEEKKKHVVSIHAPAEAPWDLSKQNYLSFSLLEAPAEDGDVITNFCIRIGRGVGQEKSYHEYRPSEKLWTKQDQSNWTSFKIPLKAIHADWVYSYSGAAAMQAIEWIEIRFETNAGMALNFDNFEFQEK